jgi:hypothetical protein
MRSGSWVGTCPSAISAKQVGLARSSVRSTHPEVRGTGLMAFGDGNSA